MRYNEERLESVFMQIKNHVYSRLPDVRLQSTIMSALTEISNVVAVDQYYIFSVVYEISVSAEQSSRKAHELMHVVRRCYDFCDKDIDYIVFAILHEIGHI